MPILLTTLAALLSVAPVPADPPADPPASCQDPHLVEVGTKPSKSNRWERDVACGVKFVFPSSPKTASVVPTATPASEVGEKMCTLVPDAVGVLQLPEKGKSRNCDELFADDVAGWLFLVDDKWTGIEWEAPETSTYLMKSEDDPLPVEVAYDQPHYRKLPSQVDWVKGESGDMGVFGSSIVANGGQAVARGGLEAALAAFSKKDTGLQVLVSVPDGSGEYQLAKLKVERTAAVATAVKGPELLRTACRELVAHESTQVELDARNATAKANERSEEAEAVAKRSKLGTDAARRKGLADKAKDLAEQAEQLAEEAKGLAEKADELATGETRKTRRNRWKARAKATRAEDWGYVICINAVDPNASEAVIVTTREGADPLAERTGTHIFSGRPIDVRVWANPKATVKVDLGGTAGLLNRVADPPGAAKAAVGVTKATAAKFRKQFAGRSTTEDFVDLKVTQTVKISKDKTETLPEVVIPLRVEDAWVGAFRVAASAAWAPWDRTWKTRTRNTALNPGEEIAIDEGADSGLAHVELVAGYSVFWWPVYEDERTVSAATSFGLGVLSSGESKGLDLFSSVHITPVELVVGRYFGVGLDVSLRRTERLRSEYDVGSPISNGQDFTAFGVTPAFGVTLNFSPKFVETVGLARKGFGG